MKGKGKYSKVGHEIMEVLKDKIVAPKNIYVTIFRNEWSSRLISLNVFQLTMSVSNSFGLIKAIDYGVNAIPLIVFFFNRLLS